MVRLLKLRFGARTRRSEVTFFDADHYLSEYKDIAESGMDPFAHFMQHGWKEGRNPSAAFETLYYRDRYLDGRPVNPLTHYVTAGIDAGLRTKPRDEQDYIDVQMPVVLPFFNAADYFTQVEGDGTDALQHYLRRGWRENVAISSEVDLGSYAAHFDHIKRLGVSPLYHYASQERLNRWLAAGGEAGEATHALPFEIAGDAGRERRRIRKTLSAGFERAFYLSRYDDVREAGLDPLDHFIDRGWREGRRPNSLFDTVFYLQEYADRIEAGMNPYYHYLTVGRASALRPNPVGFHLYPRMTAPRDIEWSRAAPAAALDGVDCVVVMPVYKGYDETLASIHAILTARQTRSFALLVVDDRSPDKALSAKLAELAARGLFALRVNEKNLGFVRSVNGALRVLTDRLVVLINTDTIVSGDWLDRMMTHAETDPTIATVTPLSNWATICSYPSLNENNMIEPEVGIAELDRLASWANKGRSSEIPTGIGFCFLMSVASRQTVGLFDEEAFGMGYGEECDFCRRAAKAGFRNVAAEDVFVYHVGEVSFGKPVAGVRPGQKALHAKHPDYPETIRQHLIANPTETGRIRLDLMRLAAFSKRKPVVIVHHSHTGGIATYVKNETRRLEVAGVDVVLIRVGVKAPWNIEIASGASAPPFMPNLRPVSFYHFREHLADFLSWLRPQAIDVHSFVGFEWDATVQLMALIASSGAPYHYMLHDYSVVCQRHNLVRADNRYCGLAEVERCRACMAMDRSYPHVIDPAVLRATYARFLEGAARVRAPSRDIAERLHHVGARYAIDVVPHADEALSVPALVARADDAVITIATLGAIGAHKGSRIILSLARDAKARDLPVRYRIVGYSDIPDDLATVGVKESGRFLKSEDAMQSLASIGPQLVFLPSIWPETWSYTLSMTMAMGLTPVVFDIGAPAARLREAGVGVVLPYALIDDIGALNDRLIALGGGHGVPRDHDGRGSVSTQPLTGT